MEDPATVAAIMVEPIGHTGGVIDPPEEYLPLLREICDRHNILLIFDEIITGIGRTGQMFAAADVRRHARCALRRQGAERRLCADLGDDLPQADRRRLLGPDRQEPGLRRGAHVRGQPDRLRRGDRRAPRDPRPRPLRQRAAPGRSGCASGSRNWRGSIPVIGDIRGKGLFQAIEFVRDRATSERFPDAVVPGRQGRPPGACARAALPVRPALDRLRPAADRHGRADRRDGRDPRSEPGRGARRDEARRPASTRAEVIDRGRPMIPRVRTPARLRIYLRFVRYLLWEFRWPLAVFASLVLGGGLILHWRSTATSSSRFARACHAVFLMIFLESSIDFPDEWYLQPLFFLFPLVGLGAIADSSIRLAFLMFTRKQNQPEWNRMLASLCRNHIVVVGVGRVGYQVIKGLLELRETVVAIEMATGRALLLGELYDKGIPVIQGNARMASVLEQAGVRKARAVIVTTSDDLTNLDTALTARDINAEARIVIRLFDETLATKVAGAFAMPTISTSQVAAPAFIAAATGRKVYQGFQLAGKHVHLTDLTIFRPAGSSAGPSARSSRTSRSTSSCTRAERGVNVNPERVSSWNRATHPGDRPHGRPAQRSRHQSTVRSGPRRQ